MEKWSWNIRQNKFMHKKSLVRDPYSGTDILYFYHRQFMDFLNSLHTDDLDNTIFDSIHDMEELMKNIVGVCGEGLYKTFIVWWRYVR